MTITQFSLLDAGDTHVVFVMKQVKFVTRGLDAVDVELQDFWKVAVRTRRSRRARVGGNASDEEEDEDEETKKRRRVMPANEKRRPAGVERRHYEKGDVDWEDETWGFLLAAICLRP